MFEPRICLFVEAKRLSPCGFPQAVGLQLDSSLPSKALKRLSCLAASRGSVAGGVPKFWWWLVGLIEGFVYPQLQQVTYDRWFTKPAPLFYRCFSHFIEPSESLKDVSVLAKISWGCFSLMFFSWMKHLTWDLDEQTWGESGTLQPLGQGRHPNDGNRIGGILPKMSIWDLGGSIVMGVPQLAGWFIRENSIKMDDLGVHPIYGTPYLGLFVVYPRIEWQVEKEHEDKSMGLVVARCQTKLHVF